MVILAIGVVIYWVVVPPLGYLLYEGPKLPVALGAFIGMVILVIFNTLGFRPVWRYVYSEHVDGAVLVKVEAALEASGLAYTRHGPYKVSFLGRKRDVFDVHPAQIVVDKFGSTMTVYLGPLREDNQDQVERLKGLVARALG